jgi:hypothetical protein
MGLTSSTEATTTSDVVNEAITNVLMENASNCTAVIDQQQNIRRRGKSKWSDISQYGELNANCLQANQVTSAVTNDIAAEIYQQAEATQTQLLGTLMADTEATAISNIQNIVETNIDFSFLQECSAAITQEQNIDDNGWIIGSDVNQEANLYQECIQKNIADTQVANDIVANVHQEVQAETESFLGGLFDDIATIIIMAIILIVVIGMIFFFIMRGGGGGKKEPVMMGPRGQPAYGHPQQKYVPPSAFGPQMYAQPAQPAYAQPPKDVPPVPPASGPEDGDVPDEYGLDDFRWVSSDQAYTNDRGNWYDPEYGVWSTRKNEWIPIAEFLMEQ